MSGSEQFGSSVPTTHNEVESFWRDISGVEPEYVLKERIDNSPLLAHLERWRSAGEILFVPDEEIGEVTNG